MLIETSSDGPLYDSSGKRGDTSVNIRLQRLPANRAGTKDEDYYRYCGAAASSTQGFYIIIFSFNHILSDVQFRSPMFKYWITQLYFS